MPYAKWTDEDVWRWAERLKGRVKVNWIPKVGDHVVVDGVGQPKNARAHSKENQYLSLLYSGKVVRCIRAQKHCMVRSEKWFAAKRGMTTIFIGSMSSRMVCRS